MSEKPDLSTLEEVLDVGSNSFLDDEPQVMSWDRLSLMRSPSGNWYYVCSGGPVTRWEYLGDPGDLSVDPVDIFAIPPEEARKLLEVTDNHDLVKDWF